MVYLRASIYMSYLCNTVAKLPPPLRTLQRVSGKSAAAVCSSYSLLTQAVKFIDYAFSPRYKQSMPLVSTTAIANLLMWFYRQRVQFKSSTSLMPFSTTAWTILHVLNYELIGRYWRYEVGNCVFVNCG